MVADEKEPKKLVPRNTFQPYFGEGGGNAFHLNFTSTQINYGEKKPSPATMARLAAQLRKEDSYAWKLLAQAMEKDLHNL